VPAKMTKIKMKMPEVILMTLSILISSYQIGFSRFSAAKPCEAESYIPILSSRKKKHRTQ
jgi:hypothetical protein